MIKNLHRYLKFCGTLDCSPEVLLGNKYIGPELDCWTIGIALSFILVFSQSFDKIIGLGLKIFQLTFQNIFSLNKTPTIKPIMKPMINPLIRFTPPRQAKRLIAGFFLFGNI